MAKTLHIHSNVAEDARVVHLSFLSFLTKQNGVAQTAWGERPTAKSLLVAGRWSTPGQGLLCVTPMLRVLKGVSRWRCRARIRSSRGDARVTTACCLMRGITKGHKVNAWSDPQRSRCRSLPTSSQKKKKIKVQPQRVDYTFPKA